MLKYELQKLFSNKLFFLSIALVFGLWMFIINSAYIWSPNGIILKALTFWNKLGSLILGLMILMINTRIFYIDVEENVEEVFNTTKFGKGKLFNARLLSAIIFTVITSLILACINLILSFVFIRTPQLTTIPMNMSILSYSLMQFLTVILGGISFTICAACICDIFKSHNITLIICGLLYGISYITNTSLVEKFSMHWFLEKGFFSYPLRGKMFVNSLWEIMFWVLWYVFLTWLLIIVNKKIRLRRKEL